MMIPQGNTHEEAKNFLEYQKKYVAYLEACEYLYNLVKTATYNSCLSDEQLLFNGRFFEGKRLPQVIKKVKHYRFMMESEPDWKKEAYKMAKIYDMYDNLF